MLTIARSHTEAPAQDIVDLLIECHDRLRTNIDTLKQFGEACDLNLAQVGDAADTLRRYFRDALPLHAADEEASVLPRLRGLDGRLDEELDIMCAEHDAQEPILTEVLRICGELTVNPARHPARRDTLRALAASLERHFGKHIEREETIIFPAIRARLDVAAREEMVRELRARRDAV
jgi:hemerythrin-like domain-containing protein